MRVYSETILAFLGQCQKMAREILSRECLISCQRTRFTIHNISYPLQFFCFEGSNRWAYFDSHHFSIGINQKIIGRVNDITLKDLLRHELAHYLCSIYYPQAKAHGLEFRSLCQSFGWSDEVALSQADLFTEIEGDLKADALIEKVKKLLALASSDNPHEAELATIKANQLILKHHLSRSELDDEKIYIKTLVESPKRNALMMALYEILSHFMVRPILNLGQGRASLEVAGNKDQIELADYIGAYLLQELPRLWAQAAQSSGLKGLRDKNSFYLGIARGFRQKLKQSRSQMDAQDNRSLIQLEGQLEKKVDYYLGGFSKTSSSQRVSSLALESGRQAGEKLSIHQAVKHQKNSMLFLE
jgi:hypothetical protein